MKKIITVINENNKEFTYTLFHWRLAWFFVAVLNFIVGYLIGKS